MDFIKWYKDKIESGVLEPPENIWDNIQDELDINQAWNVVNNQLAQKAAAKRNRILAAAASLLLIISASAFWLFRLNDTATGLHELAQEVNSVEEKILESSKNEIKEIFKGNSENTELIDSQIETTKLFSEIIAYTDTLKSKREENIESITVQNVDLSQIDNKSILLNQNKKELRLADIYFGELPKEEEFVNRRAFNKIYIGATGQLANTWLLNEKTYNGMQSSSLVSSNTSFGSNFGVYIGTNLFRNIGLQLDLNLLAQNNQSYNEYINGRYVENQMRFNYSQLALSLRYYIGSKRFLQGGHGINLGAYVAYLNNAYQTINGQTTNLSNDYEAIDYGVVLSYEYIFPVYNQLGLGTGFRAYYGLQNIYAGNEFIPSYLNKTQNASISLSLSLRYNIK